MSEREAESERKRENGREREREREREKEERERNIRKQISQSFGSFIEYLLGEVRAPFMININ